MKKLLLSFTLFIVFMATAYGRGIQISDVKISCFEKYQCSSYKDMFKGLKRRFDNYAHLHDVMKFFISSEGFSEFSYKVLELDNKLVLSVFFKRKDFVLDVETSFIGKHSIELPTILPVKKNDFLDEEKIRNTKDLLVEICENKGFPNSKINIIKKRRKRGTTVIFKISLMKPIIISNIVISSQSEYLKNLFHQSSSQFLGKPFDYQVVKNELEETRQLSLQHGYYLLEFETKYKYLSRDKVELIVNVKNDLHYTFYFQGNSFLSTAELKSYLSTSLIATKRTVANESIIQTLKLKYESYGFLNAKIKISKLRIFNHYKEEGSLYKISIEKGQQNRINRFVIKGNTHFSYLELMKLYKDGGTDLSESGIFDKAYFEKFIEILREKYILEGFVNVYLEKPVIQYDKELVNITVRIREGLRAYVSSLKFSGIKNDLKATIQKLLQTKKMRAFNPIAFKEDIGVVQKFLRDSGFYYATIQNLNAKNIVTYAEDNSQVNILLDINAGPKVKIGETVIIGNKMTRSLLIKRSAKFKKGKFLNRTKLEEAQTKLLGLGLFSSVKIKPISGNSNMSDILISVKEKDFGSFEVAPGIRTDLGLKVSTQVSYNNIDGMNKKIVFKGSVNRRYDLSTLHPDRRDDVAELIEFDTDVSFSENNIFNSDYNFEATVSKSRKRLYSFDADIQKVSYTVSRDFARWLNVSLRQQIEAISQFDAVDDDNHGHFQIGSMTPSLTFDFRDNPIIPTKGSFFNLSVEFANPFFQSQDNEELTIDYYKLVNRNRFYFPIRNTGVLAISTAMGIQENLATNEDIIPSIKVFRLSGPDIVRGFEDQEINRLVNTNEDISQFAVNKRAYMVNFKIEPRFFLSDSTMLGLFYDAGRVFVDEFKSDELRSSVGLSFKYLTPVGSLDFDYGIKLLRNKDSDGRLDVPGRLHVSIGFF